jgi:hypothetical protein
MLNHVGLPATLRQGLWAEAATTASMIANGVLTKDYPTAPHKLFFGKEPNTCVTYRCLVKSAWF